MVLVPFDTLDVGVIYRHARDTRSVVQIALTVQGSRSQKGGMDPIAW